MKFSKGIVSNTGNYFYLTPVSSDSSKPG